MCLIKMEWFKDVLLQCSHTSDLGVWESFGVTNCPLMGNCLCYFSYVAVLNAEKLAVWWIVHWNYKLHFWNILAYCTRVEQKAQYDGLILSCFLRQQKRI